MKVTWHLLGMFFWEIYEIFRTGFTRNTRECQLLQLVVAGKCFDQKIFFKKYLIRFDIQWHVLPEIKCITEVWRPFRCLSWFVLGLFGSLLFRLYSSGQAARSQALSRLHIQLFFLNKFQGGGLHMVAQERINVHETVGRKNN